MQWDEHPLTWDQYPYRPLLGSCTEWVRYTVEMPTNALSVHSYARADFWNLLPWVGPHVRWGQGSDGGIDVLQDHPPFYHECTLARDFIAHWPSWMHGSDASVVGRCGVMVPMVCAYCWGHTWRRCDRLPRVGSFECAEARLSPILDECDHCGRPSDHHIARCVIFQDAPAVVAIVSRGAASIYDILRIARACASVCSPNPESGVPVTTYNLLGGAPGLATLQSLTACVRIPFRDALESSAPAMSSTRGICSIILEYWQGVDDTSPLGFGEDRNTKEILATMRGCSHSFPCAPNATCFWTDDWVYNWVSEAVNADPRLNDWLGDHVDFWFPQQGRAAWKPDSWAIWDVFRTHDCPGDRDDAFDEDDARRDGGEDGGGDGGDMEDQWGVGGLGGL